MQIAQITLDTAAAGRTGEDELVSSCVNGDTRGFDVLVRRYQDRIFNALFRMCGNREDAEELAQEAFLRAFEKLDTFNGKSRFYTWLFRIAVNMALTRRRKGRGARFVSLGACCGDEKRLVGEEEMADIAARRDPSPERSAIDGETSRRVSRAIGLLDEQLRAVVILRDIEDMKYREISEILNIPPGTVKSRLHSARCLLRDRLADLLE